MNLTDFFNSLPNVDKAYNKYASYSLAFNNPYRICTSFDAFKYDGFDMNLKRFLADQGKCIVMPSLFKGEVISVLFRSLQSKQFRYYTEYPYIPYGAGTNNKPYHKPWVIVESALDSDFLRNFYPFVISTNGTSVSSNTISFLKGTCSSLYCGMDMDEAGNRAFHNLCSKHSGADKYFHIKRLNLPFTDEGKPLKDFGEVLDCLYHNNMNEYDFYCSQIKYNFTELN